MTAAPFAQLNGTPLTKLHLVIPALGIWHADVTASSPADMTGPQTLVLSGSTWTCATVRAIKFAGSRSARLVGGAAGWRKVVPALQYQSPVGVPTVTVMGDAAALVGELPPVLDASVPATVGTGFVRQSGPASLVLQQIVDDDWWMDSTGVVQTMPRPATVITTEFSAEEVRGAAGWYKIATEDVGSWLPGAAFSGVTVSGSISRVEHRVDRLGLWTEVLVP